MPQLTDTPLRARYTGSGAEYHAGIPARDLEPEDLAALTDEQRALVKASAIYTLELIRDAEPAPVVTPRPAPAPAARPDKAG